MPKVIHNGEEIEMRITWKYFFFQKLKVYVTIEVLRRQPQLYQLYASKC